MSDVITPQYVSKIGQSALYNVIQQLPVDKVMQQFPVDKVMQQFNPIDRLKGLSYEDIQQYLDNMKTKTH